MHKCNLTHRILLAGRITVKDPELMSDQGGACDAAGRRQRWALPGETAYPAHAGSHPAFGTDQRGWYVMQTVSRMGALLSSPELHVSGFADDGLHVSDVWESGRRSTHSWRSDSASGALDRASDTESPGWTAASSRAIRLFRPFAWLK